MRRWLRDETGAVAITVAILTIVIMALVAIVLDVGYLYAEKRQLQSAADAAALAGCWELAHDQPSNVVLARADEYAQRNAVAPGDGLTMIQDPPYTVVGADYVKVTVTKDSPLFFANVFGMSQTPVAAQAVAKVMYLTGIENPMPWALPILNVTHGEAWIDGGARTDLAEDNGHWVGDLPASNGDVNVVLYNDQTLDPNYPNGVPEHIGPVARVVVLPPASRFAGVELDDAFFTSGWGESTQIRVMLSAPLLPGESVRAGSGNNPPALAKVTDTLYEGTIDAPSTEELWEAFPIDVMIKDGGKVVEQISPAAYLVSRRPSYPVRDIDVAPTVFPNGAAGTVDIDVELNDYEYGKVYELKVIDQGSSVGNFMALDFSEIHHTPYWRLNDPEEYTDLPGGGNGYYSYVAADPDIPPFDIHIGDTIWTKTGGMSGPQTRSALLTRFDGDNTTWDQWLAGGKQPTARLVYVPITEKVQEESGRTGLRVVTFATFFVESFDAGGHGGAVVYGRFVEYTSAPGTVGGQPPGQFSIKVPRLVKDHLDF